MIDAWGAPVAAGNSDSIQAWNTAWTDTLHFIGDPFATLATANENDESFALGSVFCGAYRLLGGLPVHTPAVQTDLERVAARAVSSREVGHAKALAHLAEGAFGRAAERWDDIAAEHRDLAAVRLAHDTHLHAGNTEGRLRSSTRARASFESGPGWNLVASQHAFALEEAGRFDEAEQLAWEALEADELDLWATHALAHVYEHTKQADAAIELLERRQATWAAQDSLAVHIWWHLALQLIASNRFDEVLSMHDALVPAATTPFRLCDLTSMLWRLELEGVDVGDRWDHLADAVAVRPERHTSGFLDLHSAMVYTRRPEHPEAHIFFDGLTNTHAAGDTENDQTFRNVVRPLVDAVRLGRTEPARAAALMKSLDATTHRVGGSNAQREIIDLTRLAYERSAEAT